MAKLDRQVLARLRRVFEDGHEARADLAEGIVQAYAEALEPGQALRLERWMTCVASAAEELGQAVGPEAILQRARELEGKLS